jgi:hypothetical protein
VPSTSAPTTSRKHCSLFFESIVIRPMSYITCCILQGRKK